MAVSLISNTHSSSCSLGVPSLELGVVCRRGTGGCLTPPSSSSSSALFSPPRELTRNSIQSRSSSTNEIVVCCRSFGDNFTPVANTADGRKGIGAGVLVVSVDGLCC